MRAEREDRTKADEQFQKAREEVKDETRDLDKEATDLDKEERALDQQGKEMSEAQQDMMPAVAQYRRTLTDRLTKLDSQIIAIEQRPDAKSQQTGAALRARYKSSKEGRMAWRTSKVTDRR